MAEEMDMSNPNDEEEQERKLLEESSNDEDMGCGEKIDDEVNFESESGDEFEKSKDAIGNDNEGDSDDNDDEDAQDQAAEAEIKRLESVLAQNPYDYETHVQLIGTLHKMGELDRLRIARENMSAKYPLSPEIWLSWLRDEMKVAVTLEQKISITELCERATHDYLSVEIWLEYLQFSMGLGTEKEMIEKIRHLFERALTAAGLHVMKGSLIWDVFREFENIRMLMMEPDDSEQKDQVNRIGKLYRRQLACPLIGMEKTFEEYEMWRSTEGSKCTEDESIIKNVYKKALEQLAIRKPFEEKIEISQNKSEQLDAYKAYLIKEKQIGDPGRVTILYERAIADISLEPTLWIDYTNYVQNNIKIDEITEKLYSRAVRNVPWSVQIWQNWMRFYEKKQKSLYEMQKLIENALEVGFSTAEEYKCLWLTYLEYLRRRIDEGSKEKEKQLEILRSAFNRACDHLATFGFDGDRNCDILQFWARTEAIYANNMEKARSLWADIMSQGLSDFAASWLEYISLEKCYGDTKHLRKLFQKALTSVKDWPESITNAWINFERDEGTLEQMEQCELKIKEKLCKVAEERNKAQQFENVKENVSLGKKSTNKRKLHEGRWKNLEAKSKVAKMESSKSAQKIDSHANKAESFHKISNNTTKSKVAPPPGYEEDNDEKMEEEAHNLPEVDDNITIFVSNLDYDTTEEEVKEALESVGPITLFKMIKDYKGRNKGFCYVQLSCPEAVEKALTLDRTRIKNRPMFISRCDPNKTSRKTIFKYKTELEKNKLFVKGLSPNTTKETLEEVFKVFGNLKDVRIVTYRNGHSKGLAYIEFEDEQSTAKALIETDGKTIDSKEISVAISQPPRRNRTSSEDESHLTKSLGGTITSRSTFGNPKTVLSLIPRTVLKNTKTEGVSGNGVAQPLSNADFRNMLLNKK
ncbi:squamous cell carcinoma antigen recognized by T-cells 3-like [Phymastichus coffea]|uniref:squamous cell carcinoma antigen recognized by T-cells 3-like n=1 Tax=Phymastichus coffea TaxID=108790 RepID=UPI00273CC211|nr:squamous cell carcinoma antigen recognized by T-cells 3-like [Phymastichus coffea]